MNADPIPVPAELFGPCVDCHHAGEIEWHGFTYGCHGCAARAAARSQAARDTRITGKSSRDFMAICDLYGVTPAAVRDAARLDKLPPPKERTK